MIYMNIIKHPHILFSFEYFCGSSPGRPIRWHCNDVTKATVTHMIRNNILLSQLDSTSLSLQQCPTIHIPVSLPQQLYVGEGSLCIQTHSFWNPSFLSLGGDLNQVPKGVLGRTLFPYNLCLCTRLIPETTNLSGITDELEESLVTIKSFSSGLWFENQFSYQDLYTWFELRPGLYPGPKNPSPWTW